MSDEVTEAEPKYVASGFSEESKRHLIQFGVFAGVLLFLFALLLVFTLLSRSAWYEGLGVQVQKALDESNLGYRVSAAENIANPFSVSCASYRIESIDRDSAFDHAVILRVTTLYGPLSAVYLYRDGDKAAAFVSYVGLSEKTKASIENATKASQIKYWAERIPIILEDVKGGE